MDVYVPLYIDDNDSNMTFFANIVHMRPERESQGLQMTRHGLKWTIFPQKVILFSYFPSFQTGEMAEKKSIQSTISSSSYLGDVESSTLFSSLRVSIAESWPENILPGKQTTPESKREDDFDILETKSKVQQISTSFMDTDTSGSLLY